MTGQSRKKRNIDFEFDAETVGFYQSIGIEEVGRSLPYQPWDKPIERFFSTVCSKFSKWFESYTGTLTGSKTYAKRQKDVDGMLERGELLTMEEFFEAWTKWKNEKYHTREHRGLKGRGREVDHADLPLLRTASAMRRQLRPRVCGDAAHEGRHRRVTNQGINKFGTLYTDYELCHYVGKHVGIKWDIDDVTKLYVFDQEGRKICEAVSAELLAFGPHCSQAALERHLRDQKRQEKEMREILDSMTRPYELRVQEGGRPSEAVGMIDLTIKADRPSKLISLPNDKEFRAEMATNRKTGKKASGDEFLGKKADDALSSLEGYERIGGTTWKSQQQRPRPQTYTTGKTLADADQRLPRSLEDQHRHPGERDPGLFPPDDLPLPLRQVRGGHLHHREAPRGLAGPAHRRGRGSSRSRGARPDGSPSSMRAGTPSRCSACVKAVKSTSASASWSPAAATARPTPSGSTRSSPGSPTLSATTP